jgi:MFS family permease
MATFQPADTLRTRTFVGLLVAQFLAAFNDQAIHASAMFFAINCRSLDEGQAITLMPILFYAPWAIFCTLAGYLADRYSKRDALVFWKVAEVGITLVALLGFWVGTRGSPAGPWLLLATVFLMGTHSAFFVPAKYGAMPEILQPHLLSRGNGILESLSFLAVILGTVFGGLLSYWYRGEEYHIGLILVGLAVGGAVASLLIRRMPAANPGRPFPRDLYRPLWANLRVLFGSRPLAFSVIGIAFFTFLVAFMRATVYMHGEVQSPPWSELQTSLVVGMVALGIGLGSPLVGYLSGGKVEPGLVPIGAAGMIAATLVAAASLDDIPRLVACIVLIGFFTGFYLVPLFTLLQSRAPKTGKGDAVATSNFINVAGAIAASLVFFAMGWAAKQAGLAVEAPQYDRVEGVLAEDPVYHEGRLSRFVIADPIILREEDAGNGQFLDADGRRVIERREGRRWLHQVAGADIGTVWIDALKERPRAGEQVVESTYVIGGVMHHRLRRSDEPQKPAYDQRGLPVLLFVSAAGMTLLTLLLLWREMPGLFLRTLLWFRALGRYRLRPFRVANLPARGPVLLVTNAEGREGCLQVLAATDRTARFLFEPEPGERPLGPLARLLAAPMTVAVLDGAPADAEQRRWISERGRRVLGRGEILGLPLAQDPARDPDRARELRGLYEEFDNGEGVAVVPAYWELGPQGRRARRVSVVFGPPLPPGSPPEAVRRALERLGAEFREQVRSVPPDESIRLAAR